MKHSPLVLPALRGSLGDWIYYSCLMPVSELGTRVKYAEEVHPDKALSQLIQRSLEGPRARHNAESLLPGGRGAKPANVRRCCSAPGR
jgi:DNA sulfur modification protein DndB